MQLGRLSIVCMSLHTYVGCRSETVSETCIDCSRVTESACDCKETKEKSSYIFSHAEVWNRLENYHSPIPIVVLLISVVAVIATTVIVRISPPPAAAATAATAAATATSTTSTTTTAAIAVGMKKKKPKLWLPDISSIEKTQHHVKTDVTCYKSHMFQERRHGSTTKRIWGSSVTY